MPRIKAKIQIQAPCLIIVEGKSECVFFRALFEHHGLSGFQIVDAESKDKIYKTLLGLVSLEKFEEVHTVLIIRDADQNPQGALQSAAGVLRRVGLSAPLHHAEMQNTQAPQTGVFIMPNGVDQGMLEDLLLESVSEESGNALRRRLLLLPQRGKTAPQDAAKGESCTPSSLLKRKPVAISGSRHDRRFGTTTTLLLRL